MSSDIKKYYKVLSKENIDNLSSFNKLFIENFNLIKLDRTSINKNNKFYKKLMSYVSDNKYSILEDDLFNYLKKDVDYKYSYKELYEIKQILNNIIVEEILIKIEREFNRYLEQKKINESFAKLSRKKGISINNYYSLNELTSDYTLYRIYDKLTEINNHQLFKSFLLTLKLYNKNIDEIIEKEKINDANFLLFGANLFDSLNNINNFDKEHFYKLSKIENLLDNDSIYRNMASSTKDLYRKKLMFKINKEDFILKAQKENIHVGLKLFSNSSLLYKMNYKNIDDLSKTLVIIHNKINSFDEIDHLINIIENSIIDNLYFYIETNNNYQISTYYKNVISSINKPNLLTTINNDILNSIDIKYVINLNNTKSININSILSLINIMEHPLNSPVIDLDTNKVKKGFALISFNINNLLKDENNYIYNYRVYYEIYAKEHKDFSLISNYYLNKKTLSNVLSFKKEKEEKKILQENNNNIDDLLILNNANYSVIANNSFSSSRYNNLELTKENTNNYFLINDGKEKFTNIDKDSYKYKISSEDNIIEIEKEINDTYINTKIAVSLYDDIEIRKLSIKNLSNKERTLEITSFIELNSSLKPLVDGSNIIINYNDKKIVYRLLNTDNIDLRTNKLNVRNGIYNNIDYSNYPSPLVSFKTNTTLESNSTKDIYLIAFVTDELNLINDLGKYTINYLESTFKINSCIKNINDNTYNKFIDMIMHPLVNENRNELIKYNKLDLTILDKYDVDITLPSILIEIENEINIEFIKDVIKFHKYVKESNYYMNIILLAKNKDLEKEILELEEILLSDISKETKGKIIFLDYSSLLENEMILLYLIPTYIINNDKYYCIKDFIDAFIAYSNKDIDDIELLDDISSNTIVFHNDKGDKELEFFNNYGGFENNGREYTITNLNTPLPWKNYLISKNVKSVISNKENYTLYKGYNITKTNDDYSKTNLSERFKINDNEIIYSSITHGLGYSIYRSITDDFDIEIKEILSSTENIKVYKLTINNKKDYDIKLKLSYIINPKMYLDRYMITNHYKENNLITFKSNSTNLLFITSTEKMNDIKTVNGEKEIDEVLTIKANSTKQTAFTAGIDIYKNIWFLKEKYSNISSIETSIKITEKTIYNNLCKLNVSTNNNAFDYLINYWLLYEISINEDKLELENYIGIVNYFRDTIIYKLKYYKDIDSKYINTLYNYIYNTSNTTLLSNETYNKIKEYIDNNIESTFKYLDTLSSFIKLSKIYDKNIDMKLYKDREKEIINNLKNNNIDDIIYKSELLIRDINSDLDKEYIINNLDINNYKDNFILYLKVLNKLKEYNLLYNTLNEYNPINITKDASNINKHLTEPYFVYDNITDIYNIAVSYILGIRITNEKLFIKPHLPDNIKNYKLTYKYGNTTYNIIVNANAKNNEILIDDYKEEVDYIKLKSDFKVHNVIVNIKEK